MTERMAEEARGAQRSRPPRPKLSAENATEYLDWLLRWGTKSEIESGMQAVELCVRMKMAEAQAKTTHAQLIEQGVVDGRPAAG